MAEKDWRDADWTQESYKNYAWFFRLLRGAVLIGVGVLVGMLIYAEPQVRADYVMNLFVTMLSLGATALIFDELNRKRSEDDLKRQLVDDAASMSNEIAKNAVHQIRRKGWLEGENGLLKRANLRDANLQGADLSEANLQGADLDGTNMRGADLRGANLLEARFLSADLQRADLQFAKLQKAELEYATLQGASLANAKLQNGILVRANLQGAILVEADLRGAVLDGADLQNADLRGANLREAGFLRNALFNEASILPDMSQWTPKTDMRCFTDPRHPNFWQPDWVKRVKGDA